MRFFVQQEVMTPRFRGYGVCWRVSNMPFYLTCPIPFNVALRLIRGFGTWLHFPWLLRGCTRYEQLENRAVGAELSAALLKDKVSGLEWQVEHLRAILEKRQNEPQSS